MNMLGKIIGIIVCVLLVILHTLRIMMIDRNKQIKMIRKAKVGRKQKRTHDIIVENWHAESHEFGSRLYKLTMAMATESEFNDLDVIPYVSNDGHMLCKDIGD